MRLVGAGERLRQASLPAQRFARLARHGEGVQASVAAAKATFALALLSVADPVVPVVVALVALGVYNGNNLVDAREDRINRPDRARFVAAHRRPVLVLAAGASLGAVALATVHAGALAGAVTVVPVASAVVYGAAPVPGLAVRGKDLLGVNTALVAAAWAVPVAGLPLVVADGVTLPAAAAVGAFVFLRTAISVEVFNARDVAGDRAAGVATLPVALGLRGTVAVLAVLQVASVGVLAWGVLRAGVAPGPALAVVPVAAYSLVLTATLPAVTDWRRRCRATDLEYLVLGAVGLLAF